MAVRCWPREAKPAEVAALELEDHVVAVRADQGRAVPGLLVGRLGQAPGQRVADGLARARRCVRLVAQGQPALVRGDLGVGPAERLGDGLEGGQPALDHGATRVEQGSVPEAQLVAAGGALADRPEQTVALLERARVGRQLRPEGGEAVGGQLVDRGPSRAGRAGDQEHVLRREHDGPQDTAQGGCPARHAVDPDPLALSSGTLPDQRDLDHRRVAAGRNGGDSRLDPGDVGAPADQLGVGRRPVRPPPGEQDDRLEEARLAGRVGPQTSCGPGPNATSSDA